MRSLLDAVITIILGGSRTPNMSTGWESPTVQNAWRLGVIRSLPEPQLQAIIDALTLTVRYDGAVTSAEEAALSSELADLASAREAPAEDLRAVLAASAERVDAALGLASPREDSQRARRDRARGYMNQLAAALTDRQLRSVLRQTVDRIAHGSSASAASADELVALFDEAFQGVSVTE